MTQIFFSVLGAMKIAKLDDRRKPLPRSLLRGGSTQAGIYLSLCFLILSLLSACKTLAPISSPLYQAEEKTLREALPSEATVFVALEPRLLPELTRELSLRLSGKEDRNIKGILKDTRRIYAAYSPGSASGGSSQGSWYAILSGSYNSGLLRAGLSSSKALVKKGDWYQGDKGLKLALLSSRHILICNADMGAFMARAKAPGFRAEKSGADEHPINLAEAQRKGGMGLIALSPDQGLLPAVMGESSGIPIKSLFVDIDEKESLCSIELRFTFASETTAKVFSPALRVLMAAASRFIPPTEGPSPSKNQIDREGSLVRASGLRMSAKDFAALIAKFAGTP